MDKANIIKANTIFLKGWYYIVLSLLSFFLTIIPFQAYQWATSPVEILTEGYDESDPYQILLLYSYFMGDEQTIKMLKKILKEYPERQDIKYFVYTFAHNKRNKDFSDYLDKTQPKSWKYTYDDSTWGTNDDAMFNISIISIFSVLLVFLRFLLIKKKIILSQYFNTKLSFDFAIYHFLYQ